MNEILIEASRIRIKKDPIRSYYSYVSDGLLQVGEKHRHGNPL